MISGFFCFCAGVAAAHPHNGAAVIILLLIAYAVA